MYVVRARRLERIWSNVLKAWWGALCHRTSQDTCVCMRSYTAAFSLEAHTVSGILEGELCHELTETQVGIIALAHLGQVTYLFSSVL